MSAELSCRPLSTELVVCGSGRRRRSCWETGSYRKQRRRRTLWSWSRSTNGSSWSMPVTRMMTVTKTVTCNYHWLLLAFCHFVDHLLTLVVGCMYMWLTRHCWWYTRCYRYTGFHFIERQHTDARYWYSSSVCPPICLSVRLLHSSILWKQLNILS